MIDAKLAALATSTNIQKIKSGWLTCNWHSQNAKFSKSVSIS